MHKAAYSRKASRGDFAIELLKGEIKALAAKVYKVQGYRFAKPLYSAIATSLALGAIVILNKVTREVLIQIKGELKEH